MISMLILVSVVIILCVIFNKVSGKLGVPMLLFFILLGMLFGSDGIFKIHFDDYHFAEAICSTALIFIMFYGGFGTKWSEAKPVAVKAVLLSTLGVAMTAFIVGLLCHFILRIEWLESLLIGSVISSTDAASVFSILRSKKLGLKYNTASLLEVESGSNDPCSYMLTTIVLAIMGGDVHGGNIIYMIFAQLFYGIVIGVVVALSALWILKKLKPDTAGFDAILVVAVAIFAYAFPSLIGGNGYLSVYIAGIIMGNSTIKNKKSLVNFFDGVTGLMQVLIFFLLGLLSYPSQMIYNIVPAIAIALFLTFIARPVSVFAVLSPFKCNINQQLLVSWSGLRGAASIVFAIMIFISPVYTSNDIFNIVLCIVLLSIGIQGTLLPLLAKKLDMIDENADVLKTFSDYSEEIEVNFIQLSITENHMWLNKSLKEIAIPPNTLVVLLIRNNEKIVPHGDTVINKGDILVLAAKSLCENYGIVLKEIIVDKESKWIDCSLSDVKLDGGLVIMIKRDENVIIPNGDTKIKYKDILVINSFEG